MPTLHTLGHPTRRTEFTYTGSVKEGVTLLLRDSKPTVSAEFFKAILTCFRSTNIPGGFNMTDPTSGGLGFLSPRVTETGLSVTKCPDVGNIMMMC